MLRYGLLLLVLALASVACGDEAAIPATLTAQPTVTAALAPFHFESGLSYEDLGASTPYSSWGIFERASGTWSKITPTTPTFHYPWDTPTAAQTSGELHITWIDNDHLRVGSGLGDWVLSLDGTVTVLGGYDNYDYVDPAKFSNDRQWASSAGVISITVATNAGPGSGATTPRYALALAGAAQWAPVGHLLALIGNRCSQQRLFLFDPDTGSLQEGAKPIDAYPIALDWSDDGEQIIINAWAERRQSHLFSVDVATGAAMELTALPGINWLQPELSPDSAHILLGPGTPLTECDFEGAVGPTTVNRLP